MSIELPPLPRLPPSTAKTDWSVREFIGNLFHTFADRERILLARIAELEADAWPDKPTPAMRDALRTGSRRDRPSDALCDVRYALLKAARGAK